MKVFGFDRIILPVHLFGLVTDDLHGGYGIYPCPPQVRTGGMPWIMQPQAADSRPTTGCSKSIGDSPKAFRYTGRLWRCLGDVPDVTP